MNWIKCVQDSGKYDPERTVSILVACKTDLAPEFVSVSEEDIEGFLQKNSGFKFFRTSSHCDL